jgi:hypothetical protein
MEKENQSKIPETSTTVTGCATKTKPSGESQTIFHVLFYFDKPISGLQSVDICGSFTLWRLVRLTRVEDVSRGVYYHTTLQVPEGVHHYRYYITAEKHEGTKTWVEEHYTVDEDYPSMQGDSFGEASTILDLRVEHGPVELRTLVMAKGLPWIIPQSELEGRTLLTAESGLAAGRLPKEIITVMQKYKELSTAQEKLKERERLKLLRKRSKYLYSMEMRKKAQQEKAHARRIKGVDPKALPSPAVYGILPNSKRGREMIYGIQSKISMKDLNKNSENHIPQRRKGTRLIGTLEKCPAMSVFEMEDRVQALLANSREVASRMPPRRHSVPRGQKGKRATRNVEKPFVRHERIDHGGFF